MRTRSTQNEDLQDGSAMNSNRLLPRLLFVNPWIHDFAAHDLWVRPLGLLHLAETLAFRGFPFDIVDVLDRFHPAWEGDPRDRRQDTEFGTGHFFKQEIEKPDCLKEVPRRFSRYGASRAAVEARLRALEPPDIILLTSSMTYWYTGVKEMAELLRELFPKARLILGGAYATLMEPHARTTIRPDLVITGPGERPLLNFLSESTGTSFEPGPPVDGLRKVWTHYPVLKSYPLLTSRGCPFRCSFCATHLISPDFTQVPVQTVVSEIRFAASELGQTQFTFYDDALFVRAVHHIKPILRHVAPLGGDLRFHTPNGLLARFIDRELSELMAAGGFVRPRLSLETIRPDRLPDISNKVTRDQYVRALENLHRAGYPPGEIITYLIAALPAQTVQEVEEAVDFVFSTGSTVSLALFSPVPSTREHQRANLPGDIDPLLLNTTVYAFRKDPDLAESLQTLQLSVKNRNNELRND